MGCCNASVAKQASSITLFVVGLVLLILAATVPPYVDRQLRSGVYEATILTKATQDENKSIYRTFVNPEDKDAVPIYTHLYALNCTNPEAVIQGEKPNLVELGPYIYRKLVSRKDVTFHEDDGYHTVRFTPNTAYTFDPELTSKDLNPATDIITVPNLFFWGSYNLAHSQPDLFLALWKDKTDQERVFQTSSVQDYATTLMLIKNTDDKTYDEWFTGEGNPGMTGVFRTWKQQGISTGLDGKTPAFEDTRAVGLAGTDGTKFNQFLPSCDKTRLSAFVTDAARIVPLECQYEYQVHGVTLYALGLPEAALKAAPENPENAKFDMLEFDGALNVTSVKGMPVLLTKPHFLDAPQLLEQTSGLVPNRALHDIYIGVEPISGIVMDARKQLQVNFMSMGNFTVPGHDDTVFLKDMAKNLPLPAVWVSEQGRIPAGKAEEFVSTVYGAQKVSKYLLSVGASFAAVFLTLSFAWYVYERRRLSLLVADLPDYPEAQNLEINYQRI